ncbi:MAG: leucyl aminopeptidase [Nitrospinota bacterium]
MRLSVTPGNGFDQRTDALVFLVDENQWHDRLNKALAGALSSLKNRKVFEGKSDQIASVSVPQGKKAVRAGFVVLVGLGKGEEMDSEAVRIACASGARRARSDGAARIAVSLVDVLRDNRMDPAAAGQCAAEGISLGLYRMEKYKNKKSEAENDISRAVLCGGRASLSALRKGVSIGSALAAGTAYARDLINTASNEKRPPVLAAEARRMARREGLRCTVLDHKQAEKLKMGALLAVGRGSSAPPRLVAFEYRPRGNKANPIAFVGKGVTFDTGGISIKPSSGMELMTTDMSGAAAVFGAMLSVARLKPRVPVVGVAVMAENMVDGDATRPGDIVRAMSGTTIEIHNTDAEGRLVLADALHYTKTKYKPQCMIDLATLTGACMVALGNKITGMYGTHDDLIERVRELGEETGDRVWHMPLLPEFGEMMKGKLADLCNISGQRWGGANSAAAFLQHFAEGTPWVHLDIAGPSHTSKSEPYRPTGGTGVGVRILAGLAMNWKRLPRQKGKAFGTE